MSLALLRPEDLTTTISLKRLIGFSDVYNEEEFAEPVDVNVHWIDKQQARTDMNGSEFTSKAQILSLEPIGLGDVIRVYGKDHPVNEAHERSFFDKGLQFYEVYV
jgi:hypothetical protein